MSHPLKAKTNGWLHHGSKMADTFCRARPGGFLIGMDVGFPMVPLPSKGNQKLRTVFWADRRLRYSGLALQTRGFHASLLASKFRPEDLLNCPSYLASDGLGCPFSPTWTFVAKLVGGWPAGLELTSTKLKLQ